VQKISILGRAGVEGAAPYLHEPQLPQQLPPQALPPPLPGDAKAESALAMFGLPQDGQFTLPCQSSRQSCSNLALHSLHRNS
jgi:hypothetical protein